MTTRARMWMCMYFFGMLVIVSIGHQFFSKTQSGRVLADSLWGLNLLQYSKILEKVSRNEGREFEQTVLQELSRTLSDQPTLSHSSGVYPNGVVVTVTLPPDSFGHYSLDGSVPTKRHNRISAPIHISQSTVLRVKAFSESAPSSTVTASYIVEEFTTVAVVSLVMDPVYLFNRHAGIYANPRQQGRAWERPAIMSVIDPVIGSILEAEIRIRIHGGSSRGSPNSDRKSFRVIFSGQQNELKTWLGAPPNTTSPNQSEWVLRHSGSKRQLWADRFTNRIAHQIGLTAGYMRPAVLYLNGKQWGVYGLVERVNEQFIAGNEAGQNFALVRGRPLIDKPLSKSPKYSEWNQLYQFIIDNDLSDSGAYAFVESQLDIRSLIDYYALAIFMADSDRPQTNIDVFRTEVDGHYGKWKFAVWDFDGGLNYRGMFAQHDTVAWHLRSSLRLDLKPIGSPDNVQKLSATRLLRGLMRNSEFRREFKQRFVILLATTFATESLHATLNELLSDYAEVLPLEQQNVSPTSAWLLDGKVRLAPGDPEFTYDDRMAEIYSFISERPDFVAELLRKHLSDWEQKDF